MYTDLDKLCIQQDAAIQDAIAHMDLNRQGIVLVVDDDRHLVGTMTDGDVRRAVLDRLDLRQPMSTALIRKIGTPYASPITAALTDAPEVWLALLRQHNVLHLPLLGEDGRVAGMVTMDEFVRDQPALRAVVMAGGRGRRLHPMTQDTPKPMLRIGNRPLLEIIINQLRGAGIRQVQVTAHHKWEKIAEHFGDGRDFGVDLSYIEEADPLGTAGGLGLVEPPTETTLVINGDILTQVDFRAMLSYHRQHRAELTVAVRHYDVEVPYGVVECVGPSVRALSEKPVFGFFVNAGIYLLEPSVYQFIPRGEHFDMTDLIQRLLQVGHPVVSFPVREYWLDIGERREYERAEEDVRSGKVRV